MVSQRDLNQVVDQINSSYDRLLKQIYSLEEKVAALEAFNTILSKKSKEKH